METENNKKDWAEDPHKLMLALVFYIAGLLVVAVIVFFCVRLSQKKRAATLVSLEKQQEMTEDKTNDSGESLEGADKTTEWDF